MRERLSGSYSQTETPPSAVELLNFFLQQFPWEDIICPNFGPSIFTLLFVFYPIILSYILHIIILFILWF